MLIRGKWLLCEDGITRPVVEADVLGADGLTFDECFLVDTCADRTVLSATLLNRLQLPVRHGPADMSLVGIGGGSPFAVVSTTIELTHDDGGPARFRGEFAAFTDPVATDLSILGRDVQDHLDVILSRRRNDILLLAPNHQYHVTCP